MSKHNAQEPSFKNALDSDVVFTKYSHNRLLLFTLALYLRLEDIDAFAAEALTEGPDDKKVDSCHVDTDEGRAIICQSYISESWNRRSAPANKASDLTTAVSWLLAQNLEDVPELLRPKARELQDSIRNGDISRLELFYIHNCPESQNVQDELNAATKAAKSHIHALSTESIGVIYKEFGLQSIEELYRSRDQDILVEDELELPGDVLLKEPGTEWDAVVLSVPGSWIRHLFLKYGESVVSANLRGYLGLRKGSINAGIKETAEREPNNFWVYNNGITCITNSIIKKDSTFTIRGISIINGAQTAGALAESEEEDVQKVRVICRIVETTQRALVEKIVQYNNTQNIIKPSDLVSNDRIQKDLARAFGEYDVSYVHRRTTVRAPQNSISVSVVAPALCAFHGDPQTAGRNSSQIFLSKAKYDEIFPINVIAEHVYLVVNLSSAIDSLKYDLKQKISKDSATQIEREQYEALRFSMSKHFLIYIVGYVAEQLMNRHIPNLHAWKVRSVYVTSDTSNIKDVWHHTLLTILPLISNSVKRIGSPYDVTRSFESTKIVAQELQALISSLEPTYAPQLQQLRNATEV